MRSQRTAETTECVIRTVNNICFERVDIRDLTSFRCPFGEDLVTFFLKFSKKNECGTPQKHAYEKHKEMMKKGHASKLSR